MPGRVARLAPPPVVVGAAGTRAERMAVQCPHQRAEPFPVGPGQLRIPGALGRRLAPVVAQQALGLESQRQPDERELKGAGHATLGRGLIGVSVIPGRIAGLQRRRPGRGGTAARGKPQRPPDNVQRVRQGQKQESEQREGQETEDGGITGAQAAEPRSHQLPALPQQPGRPRRRGPAVTRPREDRVEHRTEAIDRERLR